MESILYLFDLLIHIDKHLGSVISSYGTQSYIILFLIIFVETGLVFAPFLPGDSLLFASGAFSAIGSFNIVKLLFLLWFAATLGDTTNYWIGHFFGKKILDNNKISFINQNHVNKTREFFSRHGGKTIFIARFVPIVRTFAPFIAGIGKMKYLRFLKFSIAGGFTWVFGFTLLGYYFGNIPFVKDNFSLVVLAIITLSVLPVVYEYLKSKNSSNHK